MSTFVAISALGIICLLFEIFNLRKLLIPFSIVALLGIFGTTCYELCSGEALWNIDVANMMTTSSFGLGFSALFILLAIFLVAMSQKFYENDFVKIADYISLKIFMLAGAVAMVSFGNIAMFFIGLEVLSIAGYVLASSYPKDKASNEAGMKYFIMGAFASSFVLFGIALLYGAFGTFDIAQIAMLSVVGGSNIPMWANIGFIMVLIGLLFKAAIAPFHFWAPDVYQGAPTLTTAVMSTLVKIAAIASLYKIVGVFFIGMTTEVRTLLAVLLVLTLLFGNITALKQRNLKRIMGYSGISHAGFMLMTVLAFGNEFSANSLLYYGAAYSFAAIAAFSVILAVTEGKNDEDISKIFGLGKRNPLLAVIMACAMMSLGGIPIFAGFFAKMFAFEQMLALGNVWLVIFGVIFSIVAICYYFKVVNVVYTKENEEDSTKLKASTIYIVVACVAITLNILLGLFPSIIMELPI